MIINILPETRHSYGLTVGVARGFAYLVLINAGMAFDGLFWFGKTRTVPAHLRRITVARGA